MADNPFQGMLNPNMNRGASMWDMRMMAAANRSEAPFERGIRTPYRGRGGGSSLLSGMSGIANEPDYSAFTYDPAMRQQAIDAGVTPLEASQVRQNAILPNTGFFGRHSRLSAALEGGLFAGANAHGGNTTGESIQGALEGIIGGQRERQGILREQFARPFEAASMLEGIADRKQERELRAAGIKRYESEAEIQQDRLQIERDKAELTRWGVTPVEGGSYLTEPGKRPVFQPGPGKPERPEVNRNVGQQAREILAGQGIDPDTATPQQIAGAHKQAYNESIGKAGDTTRARNQANAPKESSKMRDKFIVDNSKVTSSNGSIYMDADIRPGDKDTIVAQKLANYYDTRIAPYLSTGQQVPEGAAPAVKTYDPVTGTLY